jgi:superfamily I DNA/RNA helicase
VEAFESLEPGTPHNEGRDQVWEELLTILVDKHEADPGDPEQADVSEELVRRSLARNAELVEAFGRAWPLIEPTDLVGDLWSVPAYLRHCAPWLSPDEVRLLQRADPQAWTSSDLPLLDAARLRLGDPRTSRRNRRRRAALAVEQEERARVVDHLIASDDSDLQVMSMLRGDDLRGVLVDQDAVPSPGRDLLAGPFAHVVVDEAQELTDAEWQMLLRRCPSRSFTVVGDRAQARHGFAEPWETRLTRAGLHDVHEASLSINYRTPAEVMAAAEPVIRAAIPDANVPTSVRSTGVPVRYVGLDDLDAVVDDWLDAHPEGIGCVIGPRDVAPRPRVRSLRPALSKGLEFDLVVLVEPQRFGDGVEGAVDRYVAMTRATQELVIAGAS